MGTVHGVYLKYVGMSALSYVGYISIMKDPITGKRLSFWDDIILQNIVPQATAMTTTRQLQIANNFLSSSSASNSSAAGTISTLRIIAVCVLGYSVIINGLIAILFKLQCGMSIIGKDRSTGQIPYWSKILFFPFHIPTLLYTHVHIRSHAKHVPVATEVQDKWWVGSCYGHELIDDSNNNQIQQWECVIDLTVEFPESTINYTKYYLSIPTWDGVPATPVQLEQAATFAVNAYRNNPNGHILVHCAHGRGRSTTVMCACLVKAGFYKTWQDAFEIGIKPSRSVCKLNKLMRTSLTQWQSIYIDGNIDTTTTSVAEGTVEIKKGQ